MPPMKLNGKCPPHAHCWITYTPAVLWKWWGIVLCTWDAVVHGYAWPEQPVEILYCPRCGRVEEVRSKS